MELLERLIKNENYWIRFELALNQLEGKANSDVISHRAMTIFNALFDKDDEILMINCVDHHIDDKKTNPPKMKRYLRNKKLIYGLKCKTVSYVFEEDVEMVTQQYSLKVKKEEIRLQYLLKAIENVDFALKPSANGYIYLLNVTKEILFYMYDDRGCIVNSFDKETLLPLYKNFSKWIYDYDRITIDRKFEQGLHNIYETAEEAEERIKLNKKKVKEMGSKYPYIHHNITHQLEISKAVAEECINEMTQTGFEIDFEQKEQDTMIVRASKWEPLTYIDYQSELMALYSKKYNGKYNGWSVIQAY